VQKAVVSVINDLVTDQRVHKTCMYLHERGVEVTLVGRVKSDSLPMPERPYRTVRMKLRRERGPLFYLEFQWQLRNFLNENPADLLVANDLDTLWPNFTVARKRSIPLVYDAHEIFTEVPELIHRRFKQRTWQRLEQKLLPHIKHMITVNDSIANWYREKYGLLPVVVRNIPDKPSNVIQKTRGDVGWPLDKKIIVLQGAGINIDRGSEELVQAMQFVQGAVLMIIGSGDVLPKLKQMVKELNLSDRVHFSGKVSPDELKALTRLADVGVTLDKDTNINYRFSLPNKIFDYIHAGIPVLSSKLPELEWIITNYNVGVIVESHAPEMLAKDIHRILASPQYEIWQANTALASQELSWYNEKRRLDIVFDEILSKSGVK
jgi:glycosyltransferase involved in cell wall biosynthesis